MKKRLLLLGQAFAAAALLSACFGGDDMPPPPPPPAPPPPVSALDAIPPSASADDAGMAAYLQTLATLLPEDKEPLDPTSFNPPSPDNTEPEPVT